MEQDILVAEAVIECDEEKFKQLDAHSKKYSAVFRFTTENIKGMMQNISISQQDILTVCSSGDHIFNMLLCGAKTIDTYDVNVFTKYFFYFKEAAIRTLDYKTFFDFFFPNNRFIFLRDESQVFSDEVFSLIEKNIRDSEARAFWGHLFSKYGGKKIYHSSLFIKDYYSQSTYIECNNYLANEDNYRALQEKLNDYTYQFYHLNIFELSSLKYFVQKEYDFIYLSNILDGLKMDSELQYALQVKEILTSLKEILASNGMIGVCYLYSYLDDYWYDSSKGKLKSVFIRQKYFREDYCCKSFYGMANLKGGRMKDRDALMLTLKK